MISQVGINVRRSESLKLKINEIIDSKWFSEGKFCEAYLEQMRLQLRSKYAFLAPNGTLGLYLALLAIGDGPSKTGGDVLVPSFTFYGSATSILFAGYNPVFVDCNPETFQSDLQHFIEARTPNTVGIMPVHIYGQMGEIKEICDWAKSENLFTIEDAAQAVGCFKNGRSAGTFGDIGVFSTFSDKILTTGEGSVLVTQDEDLAKRIKFIRNQGRPNAGTFIHPSLGMNFRLTEFQAALGLHQLETLEEELRERREKYDYYHSKIKDLKNLDTMRIIKDSTLVPFRFPVLSEKRDLIQSALEREQVMTRNFFIPMHRQPKFKSSVIRNLPNADLISQKGLCLPVHFEITRNHIDMFFRVMSEI